MAHPAEQALGYTFNNPDLLESALTHASVAGTRLDSNERMEFLGDAILGFVVCEHIYHAYPELLEGELTKIKSAVVSRHTCAKISRKLELCSLLTLGKGMHSRQALPKSISAAVLESVIAAIYADGGLEPTKEFILRVTGPFIEEAAGSSHQQNFKSVLQQFAQRHLPRNPCYTMLDEKGPDHAKSFEVCVDIDGRRFPSSWAASKKEAEQVAARHALIELGVLQRKADGKLHVVDDERMYTITTDDGSSLQAENSGEEE